MTTDYPYPMAQWPAHLAQMAEPQLMTQEELDQQVLMAAGFPMQTDFEQYLPQLDQMEQMNWNSEMASKQVFLPPYPQSWYEAGLVNDQRKQLEASWRNSFMQEYQNQTTTPTATHHDTENNLLSQSASERALFMTPPAQSHYYPTFPGSPISELCSTPEMSHSSRWESDEDKERERERETYTSSSSSSSSSRSPYTAPDPRPKNEGDYFSPTRGVDGVHGHAHVDESESETILEMPDGTTRRTANWLPVDSSAGFTIGPEQRGLYRDPSQMDEFQDIQGAFFMSPAR